MINPFGLIPPQYKLALIAAGAVVLLAAGAVGGFAWGFSWNADDLAACEATVSRVKEEQIALEKENARVRREQTRINKETADGWSAAVAWHRAHPRIVRVRGENCGAGGIPGLSATASGNAGLRPGSGEGGLEITADQCEALANDSLLDADWIYEMKQFVIGQHNLTGD